MLKELLKLSGISQSELSRLTGINIRQIQKICSGDYKIENITAKNYILICDALKIDPHILLENSLG